MVSKLGRFNFSSASAELSAQDVEVAQAESELDRLYAELDTLKATLADREAALAKAALDAQEARDRWQEQLAARVAAAQAQSRQQSARSALAEVTAACEAAEQTLEEPGQEQARQDLLFGRPAVAQPADRVSATLQDTPRESNIVIRTNRVWAAEAVEAADQTRRASKKHALFGVVAAASLVVLAITSLATTSGSPVRSGSSQDLAVALRDVNVRAAPSTEAKIVSMLPRGVKVATIEERGSWHLIRIEGAGRDTQPRQGWVNASFLKREATRPR
jgi:hypothetical protein